jgi:hypothetical protein
MEAVAMVESHVAAMRKRRMIAIEVIEKVVVLPAKENVGLAAAK